MITRESGYAMRIIDYLKHQNGDRKVVPVRQISDSVSIPYRFARKIIGQLANAHILITVRGKNGGVRISEESLTVTIFDVLTAIDPKCLILNKCVIEPDACFRSCECNVHKKLLVAQTKFEKMFKSIEL